MEMYKEAVIEFGSKFDQQFIIKEIKERSC